MTDEERFKTVLLDRITDAIAETGHSFYGLLKSISEDGAVSTARRLVSVEGDGKFQDGMKQLNEAGLLCLSVEQVVIEFGERGKIFSPEEVEAAKERLLLVEIILS